MHDITTHHSAVQAGIEFKSTEEHSNSILERLNVLSCLRGYQEYLEGMLDLIIQKAQGGSVIYFSLVKEAGEGVVVAVRGEIESKHLIGLRLKCNTEILNPKTTTAEVYTAGLLYNTPGWLHAASPKDAGQMQYLIILPVRTPQINLGLIHLYNFEVGDLGLLQMLADRLAIELTQRDTLMQTQVHNQQLSGLIEAIGKMTGILDRNQLLHIVAEQASQLLDADRSTVFIIDPITHETIYNVSYQWDKQANQSTKNLHQDRVTNRRKELPFNYLTTNAVSASLLSGVVGENCNQNPSNLGGVMVLNKHNGTFHELDAQMLEVLTDQASSLLQVAELYESSEKLFMDTIMALVAVIEAKDPGTQGHTARVSDYSVLIAKELGLDKPEVNDIRIGSMLHDLGKIGIPETILNKKGSLTEEERKYINLHPLIGAKIIGQVEMLSAIVPGILEHHERLDGSGYPMGLRDGQISRMGKVIMVADVFDAMTSSRPYRAALSIAETLNYLQSGVDVLFNSRCVNALINILERSINSGKN